MSVFLTGLLGFLLAYGYLALGLSAFVGAAGVPLPITLLLLAAGAFSAQGDFNIVALTVIAIVALVAGDCAGYLVGRFWGSKALDWLPRSRFGERFVKPQDIERSRRYFGQHGGWAIFLTRFLITALGGVTNLVAGAESFPLRPFLLYDISGEAVGAILTLGLGFLLGASWEAMGDVLGAISLLALGLACLLICSYMLLSYRKRETAANQKAANQKTRQS